MNNFTIYSKVQSLQRLLQFDECSLLHALSSVHLPIVTYTQTYIPWTQNLVPMTTGCTISHKNTKHIDKYNRPCRQANIQKYYKNFTKNKGFTQSIQMLYKIHTRTADKWYYLKTKPLHKLWLTFKYYNTITNRYHIIIIWLNLWTLIHSKKFILLRIKRHQWI
jgi:hypothetical protein